jgi:hypothetical protein
MTEAEQDILARDLARTTTMGPATAKLLIRQAVDGGIPSDKIEQLIRVYSDGCNAGIVTLSFADIVHFLAAAARWPK